MPETVVRALDLGSRDDGDVIQFALVGEGGSESRFEAKHGDLVEIVNDLEHALKACTYIRGKAGKAFEPQSTPGVIHEVDLSTFGVTQGQDGLPRIICTLDNGSIQVIRLTANDARAWRVLLDRAVAVSQI